MTITGGTFASVGDEECTHLIIDEALKELPTDIMLPRHVVKGEVNDSKLSSFYIGQEKHYLVPLP